MPHIVIDHSPAVADTVSAALPDLHALAVSLGFGAGALRVYARPLTHQVVGGDEGQPMAHLTFRILDKPERTEEMRRGWLETLIDRLGERLPGCSLSGECIGLPPIYRSKKPSA